MTLITLVAVLFGWRAYTRYCEVNKKKAQVFIVVLLLMSVITEIFVVGAHMSWKERHQRKQDLLEQKITLPEELFDLRLETNGVSYFVKPKAIGKFVQKYLRELAIRNCTANYSITTTNAGVIQFSKTVGPLDIEIIKEDAQHELFTIDELGAALPMCEVVSDHGPKRVYKAQIVDVRVTVKYETGPDNVIENEAIEIAQQTWACIPELHSYIVIYDPKNNIDLRNKYGLSGN